MTRIFVLVGLLLIVLKLVDVISASWWLVLLPFWIMAAAGLVLVIALAAFALVWLAT